MAVVKTGTSNYAAVCDNCGAHILNVFELNGKVYGSECIKRMTGQKPDPRRAIAIESWDAHVKHQEYLRRLQDEDPLQF